MVGYCYRYSEPVGLYIFLSNSLYKDSISSNAFFASASDFYGHNDMDMVGVFAFDRDLHTDIAIARSVRRHCLLPCWSQSVYSGNGYMWYDEWKTHFTAWALMKSPLVIVSRNVLLYYASDDFFIEGHGCKLS